MFGSTVNIELLPVHNVSVYLHAEVGLRSTKSADFNAHTVKPGVDICAGVVKIEQYL